MAFWGKTKQDSRSRIDCAPNTQTHIHVRHEIQLIFHLLFLHFEISSTSLSSLCVVVFLLYPNRRGRCRRRRRLFFRLTQSIVAWMYSNISIFFFRSCRLCVCVCIRVRLSRGFWLFVVTCASTARALIASWLKAEDKEEEEEGERSIENVFGCYVFIVWLFCLESTTTTTKTLRVNDSREEKETRFFSMLDKRSKNSVVTISMRCAEILSWKQKETVHLFRCRREFQHHNIVGRVNSTQKCVNFFHFVFVRQFSFICLHNRNAAKEKETCLSITLFLSLVCAVFKSKRYTFACERFKQKHLKFECDALNDAVSIVCRNHRSEKERDKWRHF